MQPDHRMPLVMVQMWYAVGSSDEPAQKIGLSHVLEHLMFKGTPRVPADQLKQVNEVFGGSLNAFTTPDYTYYYQYYPAQYLSLALELEADRMHNLSLRYADFIKERQIVIQERQQRIDDVPQMAALEQFRRLSFANTPYAEPVLGTVEQLNALTLSDLQHWYRQHYNPQQATLVVVGDVQPHLVLQQVQRYFGDLSNIAAPSARPSLKLTFDPGIQSYTFYQSGLKVPYLYLSWRVPSLISSQMHTAAALEVIERRFFDTQEDSVSQYLMTQQGTAVSVVGQYDPLVRGDTWFTMSVIPAQGQSLKQLKDQIVSHIARLRQMPLTDDQFQQIRTGLLAKKLYLQDDMIQTAEQLGRLSINGFDLKQLKQWQEVYHTLQPSTVQHVLQQYFNDRNLTVVYVEPNP